MDVRGYFRGDFQRPSPYHSPDSMSPFRSTFVSQRSVESPTATGYNSSRTSYQEYPISRRVPAQEYGAEQDVETAQETNSRAVLNALKSLQEKISKLELDRVKAEENLKTLAHEANDYKAILQKEHELSESAQSAIEVQKRELEGKLHSAEDRCQLLEKQLKYMKNIRHSSEPTTSIRYNPYEQLPVRINAPFNQPDMHVYASPQNEKLAELERGQIKLTASQTLAESKIRELEEKLKEERHQRKLLQDRAAELQTLASTNRILLNMTSPEEKKLKKKVKKKKISKAPQAKKKLHPETVPNAHYRLDLGNIPFVVGQSATKSHSLGANIQKVFSLMKAHNPQLCNAATQAQKKYHVNPGSSATSSTESEGISELITQLQDEFGHMGFEHSDIIKQIQETHDVRLREDLERELDRLVARMETKGEQIAILKEHERKHLQAKRKKCESPSRRRVKLKGSEVEVVTTIKTKDDTPKNTKLNSRTPKTGPSPTNRNLEVLKKVQKLQGTLRQDDLSWD